MQEINLNESKKLIGGGIGFSGAILNAIKGITSTIFSIGQTVGGAIRRIGSGNLCKF